MKSFTVSALTLFLAALVAARNCTPGLDYCGQTLLNIGDYQGQVDQALIAAGRQIDNNGKDDLFHCDGGAEGIIHWLQQCGRGCSDNGSGRSDTCV